MSAFVSNVGAGSQHGAMEYSEPPVNLDLVRAYRLARLWGEMVKYDVGGLLLFDPINIEPGMALCVESFIGSQRGREGVKLEEQILVTETGVERISSYPFRLDWL